MKYKKIPIGGYDVLNMYPVYSEQIYHGREPFKIVGIREHEVELEGDYSGMNNIIGKQWFNKKDIFVVKEVCEENLKPNGCQLHNLHCCGGGSVINKHTNYWESTLN